MRINPFSRKQNKVKETFKKTDDLGLSSSAEDADARIINKDGSFNIERKGESVHVYHRLVSLSWPLFFLLVFFIFTVLNGFFALIYMAIGVENIGIASRGFALDLVETFHFSVQTMTTVGYGAMHPTSIPASIVASSEALVGLLSFALASGLMYGRFSKPTQQIKFSTNAVLTTLNDKPCLQMRIANQYSHDLMDVEARLLVMLDKEVNGQIKREYSTLTLELDKIQFMPLNWTLVHYIDDNSPIKDKTTSELSKQHAEFLLTIKFYDESFAQIVHTRTSYRANEILKNYKFSPAYTIDKNGKTVFDLDKLNDIEPL